MNQKKFYLNVLFILIVIVPILNSCQSDHDSEYISPPRSQVEQHWLPYINFDIAKFSNPPQKFGPMVRWWWPGNNVTRDELKREVRLLSKSGFAGAEIQPFSIGIKANLPDSVLSKWYSWDTEDYYKNLRAVMEQAKASGIFIDMTAGSGWPLATPVTTPEDGMKLLTYAHRVVSGGKQIDIPVPKDIYRVKDPFRTYQKADFSLAKLQVVIAARINKKDKDSGQVYLDRESEVNITDHVSNGRIEWEVPDSGNWQIVAIYSIPTMEANPFAAKMHPLLVVNHWDSTKIQAAYNYLFGERTGLEKYYGDPIRAIFNDSYEFRPIVHFAKNLFLKFRKENGYDLKPWLPQIMRANSDMGSFHNPNETSKFVLNDQGKRIKYDFNKTVGDILIDQLIMGSDHWAQARGMLHRTQPYGPGIDVIKGAGLADIPGTEQLYDGGSEGFIKLVTSGAHLYNRPVIAQESFVFWNRAFMTTPQKIKALCGKAFTAGVNQIIYHGFPYKLMTNRYGIEGWSPFNSPYNNLDFSSHINEANPFWKDIKKINGFIRRSQYVLRSGKHQADVLIYNPEIGSNVAPNPNEALVGGYFKEVEPKAGASVSQTEKKYSIFWHTVNKLMASGITWDYINEESLQQAKMENGKINIRGNSYKAIILPQVPYVTLQSAKKIITLSKEGANILIVGDITARQPGFLNYQENDQEVFRLLKQAIRQSNGHQLASAGLMDQWISKLPQKIRFNKYHDFIRQSVRRLKDGSRLDYLWNMSGQWQTISLKADGEFNHFYWLNPADGSIVADNNRDELTYHIPPYSSIILYTAKNTVADSLLSNPKPPIEQAEDVVRIKKWDITIGDTTVTNSPLFDWRCKKAFKYKSTDGLYSASFDLTKKENQKYYLDLGKVYFTAEVWINGKDAGKCIWSPYMLNITDLLRPEENKIKIRVTPTLLNELIGLGINAEENEPYSQFKDNKKQLMPAGLVGPVTIKSL